MYTCYLPSVVCTARQVDRHSTDMCEADLVMQITFLNVVLCVCVLPPQERQNYRQHLFRYIGQQLAWLRGKKKKKNLKQS